MNKKSIQKWRGLKDSRGVRGLPSLPRPVMAKVNCMRQRHTISLDLDGIKMHDHSSGEFEAIEAMDALSSAFGGGSQHNKKVSECRCQEIKTLSLRFLNGRYTQTNNQEKWKRLPKTFREELQRRWNVHSFRKRYQETYSEIRDKLGRGGGYPCRRTVFGENLSNYQQCLERVSKREFYSPTLGFGVVYDNPHVVCKRYPEEEFRDVRVMRRLQPSEDYFRRKEPHVVSVSAGRDGRHGILLGLAVWKKVPVSVQKYRGTFHNLTASQNSAWKKRYAKGQKVWGWEITVDLEDSDYERN